MKNHGVRARAAIISVCFLALAMVTSVVAYGQSEPWNSVLSKAKEEGEVSLVTAWGPEPRAAVIRAFKERYGIDAKVLSAGASQSGARILAERRANLFNVDVAVQGANFGVNIMKPAGAFDPAEPALILDEVKNPKAWFGAAFPWFDRDHTMIPFFARLDTNLAVNTDMVKSGEIKSYGDLLKPQWKGKILLTDPTIIGSGSGWFRENGRALGMDFMRALVKQQPVILKNGRQLVEWLARGKYPVLIAGHGESLAHFIKEGAPIAIVEAKDSRTLGPSSGIVSLVNRAPHENAAKVFLNWILTKEGQTIMTNTIGLPSRRVDVSTAHLLQATVPKQGETYIEYSEQSTKEAKEAEKRAREIFGSLLK
jgi:iron(III) transport system substrate-binding protein